MLSSSPTAQTLLTLIRTALDTEHNPSKVLGPSAGSEEECVRGWCQIMDLSFDHGVQAIALDGLEKWMDTCSEGCCGLNSPWMRSVKFEWLVNAMEVERLYQEQEKVIGCLSTLFAEYGLDMMVIKGYSLSLDYPIPRHRTPGDVDVYHFGRWKDADDIIAARGIRLDYSHHHHSVYNIKEQMVENHYDFMNRYSHKDNVVLDDMLKELAGKSPRRIRVGEGTVCIPPADFNALFLLRHAGAHFAAESLNLKQILDWGLFMAHHSREVNWPGILPVIRRMGSWKFFCALNGLCVDTLGFDKDVFPGYDRMEILQRRMLEDVFSPWSGRKLADDEGWLFRIGRWKANLWKHRMVYEGENTFLMFIRQGWSHLLRPAGLLKKRDLL